MDKKKLDVSEMKVGDEGLVLTSILKPTQPDDGRPSSSTGFPIEICEDRRNILVVHGNHRFYDSLRKNEQDLFARVIRNPYSF